MYACLLEYSGIDEVVFGDVSVTGPALPADFLVGEFLLRILV